MQEENGIRENQGVEERYELRKAKGVVKGKRAGLADRGRKRNIKGKSVELEEHRKNRKKRIKTKEK